MIGKYVVALALTVTAALPGCGLRGEQVGAGTYAWSWADGSLSNLAMGKDFAAARESSYDRSGGNADMRPIEPGDTLTIADIEGAGVITHIWFTIAAGDRFYPRLLTLRMYWDGEEDPSVECPVGDFFGVGHGLDAPFTSLPVAVSSNGRARNCYWPMPFRKSARITVTNEGKARVHAFYYYIDYRKCDRLPEDSLYFHAQYRQEFPAEAGKDYLILEAQGRGHYVGTVLSILQHTPSWWGEGDDRFYIDGAAEPQMTGTGSEDYLCDAWGMRRMENPFYGCTVSEGFDIGSRHTCYRWHIPDPIPFTKSLKVTIEHMGVAFDEAGKVVSGFSERADDFSSVAFWYQDEPHRRFYEMPPGPARIPRTNETLIEGEALIEGAVTSGDPMIAQNLGAGWSGGKQLFYQADAPGDFAEVRFDIEEAGEYAVCAYLTMSFDYAIVGAELNGASSSTLFNGYSPDVKAPAKLRLGRPKLAAGTHTLRLSVTDRDPRSAGYYLGLDAVGLTPVKAR